VSRIALVATVLLALSTRAAEHEVMLCAEQSLCVSLKLRFSSNDSARWPQPTVLSLHDEAGHAWRIPLTQSQVKSGVVLQVPPGELEMIVESERHRRAIRKVKLIDKPIDVALALEAFPRINGRVLSKTSNEPLAGAAISVNETVVAISDGEGRFVFDANPDDWPESVSVAAGGYATKKLMLPRVRANTDLLDIALGVGGIIHVAIERADAGTLRADLLQRQQDMPQPVPVTSKQIAADKTAVAFDDVEAGDYVLVILGRSPGLRYGKKLTVRAAEETSLTVPLQTQRRSLRVELRDEPLANCKIRLSSTEGLWQEELQTDAQGLVELAMWQSGRFHAVVTSEDKLTSPYIDDAELTGDDEWVIRIPAREVRGRVVDASSGKPVPNANVALEVKGRTPYGFATKADESGAFSFNPVRPGDHTIFAAADGYRHDQIRYSFAEGQEFVDVTIRLRPANEVRVSVRDAAGQPVVDAAVLDFTGFTLTGQRFTDANGEVVIPIEPNQVRDVYIIPRDGSFVIGTIGTAKQATFKIPPPQATIVVSSLRDKKEPIPEVWVVMRYNGVALPFEVQQMFAQQQGATPVSGPDGRIVLRHLPLGVYELWPVGSPAEVRATMRGLGRKAPVRVVAQPGLNEAVLTFASTVDP